MIPSEPDESLRPTQGSELDTFEPLEIPDVALQNEALLEDDSYRDGVNSVVARASEVVEADGRGALQAYIVDALTDTSPERANEKRVLFELATSRQNRRLDLGIAANTTEFCTDIQELSQRLVEDHELITKFEESDSAVDVINDSLSSDGLPTGQLQMTFRHFQMRLEEISGIIMTTAAHMQAGMKVHRETAVQMLNQKQRLLDLRSLLSEDPHYNFEAELASEVFSDEALTAAADTLWFALQDSPDSESQSRELAAEVWQLQPEAVELVDERLEQLVNGIPSDVRENVQTRSARSILEAFLNKLDSPDSQGGMVSTDTIGNLFDTRIDMQAAANSLLAMTTNLQNTANVASEEITSAYAQAH